jgi:hypothetical protein
MTKKGFGQVRDCVVTKNRHEYHPQYNVCQGPTERYVQMEWTKCDPESNTKKVICSISDACQDIPEKDCSQTWSEYAKLWANWAADQSKISVTRAVFSYIIPTMLRGFKLALFKEKI